MLPRRPSLSSHPPENPAAARHSAGLHPRSAPFHDERTSVAARKPSWPRGASPCERQVFLATAGCEALIARGPTQEKGLPPILPVERNRHAGAASEQRRAHRDLLAKERSGRACGPGGWPYSTLEAWGQQTPALAARHCVIAFDNRGSGRTRIPTDDGYARPSALPAICLPLGRPTPRVGTPRGGIDGRDDRAGVRAGRPSEPRALAQSLLLVPWRKRCQRRARSRTSHDSALEVLFHPDSLEGEPDILKCTYPCTSACDRIRHA